MKDEIKESIMSEPESRTEQKPRNFIQRLWAKYVNKETILYLVFGVLTTVVNWVAYYLLLRFVFEPALAAQFSESLSVDYLVNTVHMPEWFANTVIWLDLADSVPALIANIPAWAIAVIFAYIVNKLFVFESKSFNPKVVLSELWKFVLARLLSFVFEEVFIGVAVSLHMNSLVAKLIAAIVVVIMNYFASKFLIFKKKKEDIKENVQE